MVNREDLGTVWSFLEEEALHTVGLDKLTLFSQRMHLVVKCSMLLKAGHKKPLLQQMLDCFAIRELQLPADGWALKQINSRMGVCLS